MTFHLVRPLAAVAIAVMIASLSAPAATAAALPERSDRPPTPHLDWTPCPDAPDADCATLEVPVDWSQPKGETFELAVARHRATDPDARVGAMVFGPGGPGDSGVERITTGIDRFSERLQARFDIVSFDPRGVGASSPLRCSADLVAQMPPVVMRDETAFESMRTFAGRLRADCREHTGPVYEHMSTLDTVRDLEALRRALGEPRLTFHGSSYGTLLGQQYAAAHPHRVRAMVLESVNDHSLGARRFLDGSARAAQDTFDEFVTWCHRDQECPLRDSDVNALLRDLVQRAERGELSDPDDPHRALTPYDLTFTEVQRRLYDPERRPELAARLAALAAAPEPTAGTGERAGQGGAGEGSAGAVIPLPIPIFCNDWEMQPSSYADYERTLERMRDRAPDLPYPGALIAPALCLGAPPAANPQRPIDVAPGAPILLVNSRHDPATPHAWAQSLERKLRGRGVLLTYEGSGHGAYTSSPCVERIVDAYLIDGEVPPRNASCPTT
ncbi:alpha/beta hydrolase family protein [Nocardioides albertanoniae]|uniref:Alpha/beta hydrolase family protein n=1 Tax=Nocardioides albertanoniae TaxID=1175486 RepID=A0A543A6T9_9ACTN|nr:alpha/beta hydrolase [Nocardioides albertanoniae]TQL68287.1 alpha/beta hydrolase family protein [Nocardioides albertanoniae]